MKREILKEEVDQLINQAFWGKGGVRLTENTEEVTQEPQTQEEVTQDDSEQLEESAHVCPLCESKLEEDISDEQLMEHVNLMVEIISEMNDVTDEDLDTLAEDIESDEEDENDGEDLDEMCDGPKGKMKGAGKGYPKVSMKAKKG
jgi:hypothetical protein